MTKSHILVNRLVKTYQVPVREGGLRAAVRSFARRTYDTVEAVRDISFSIEPGEIVGFIGPNGAGKTTTLKMLAGLLHPTSGEVRVAGFTPWERRADFLCTISMVLGNKSQLIWDIPALDTYRVLGEIYHLTPAVYQQTLDELVELLDMRELADQARAQSLAGRANEVRTGRRIAASTASDLPRRTHAGLGHLDAEPPAPLRARLQPAPRRDRDPDQSLHGRRDGAVSACDLDPSRAVVVRRRLSPISPRASRRSS